MPKTQLIGATDLYALLERDFQRLRPNQCARCQITLPFRVDARERRANWMLDTTGVCPQRCVEIVDELVSRYQARYPVMA